MQAEVYDRARRTRLLKQFGVVILIVAMLYAAVGTPVEIWVNSDIVIAETVVPLLWDTLMMVLHFLFFWTAFAYLLLFVARFTLRKSLGAVGVCVGAVILRYGVSMVAGYSVNGFPRAEEFWSETVPYLLLDILLDCVMMGLAVLIAYVTLERPWQGRRLPNSTQISPLSRWMPFDRMLGLGNPLLRASLLTAAIPGLLQTIYRMIYDITVSGVVRDLADLLWMISYYLADFISIIIGYFVILLFFNHFYLEEEKARMEFQKDSDQ